MYYIISGIVLLIVSSILLGFGLLWTISWLNHLSKYVMLIYKDEVARLDSQYATMPPIFLALAFFLWRIAEFLLTQA